MQKKDSFVDSPLNVAPVEVALLLVVVVHGVHDVLLPVLDDLPERAADHVTRGQRRDRQPLALALETDGLAVLQLRHLLETGVHLVQGEQGKLLNIVSGLEFRKDIIFLGQCAVGNVLHLHSEAELV